MLHSYVLYRSGCTQLTIYSSYFRTLRNCVAIVAHFERAMTSKQEIQVEFNNGFWWVMPDELAGRILHLKTNGAMAVSFVWDWEDRRSGSYQFDGQKTGLSRYIIDFRTMQQLNIDTNRTRRVKVVSIMH